MNLQKRPLAKAKGVIKKASVGCNDGKLGPAASNTGWLFAQLSDQAQEIKAMGQWRKAQRQARSPNPNNAPLLCGYGHNSNQ